MYKVYINIYGEGVGEGILKGPLIESGNVVIFNELQKNKNSWPYFRCKVENKASMLPVGV